MNLEFRAHHGYQLSLDFIWLHSPVLELQICIAMPGFCLGAQRALFPLSHFPSLYVTFEKAFLPQKKS